MSLGKKKKQNGVYILSISIKVQSREGFVSEAGRGGCHLQSKLIFLNIKCSLNIETIDT